MCSNDKDVAFVLGSNVTDVECFNCRRCYFHIGFIADPYELFSLNEVFMLNNNYDNNNDNNYDNNDNDISNKVI